MMGQMAVAGASGPIVALLLGLFAGAMVAVAAAIFRSPRPAARWTGVLFALTSAAYAAKLWNNQTLVFSADVSLAITVIGITSVAWFWLFVMALFGDADRFRPFAWSAPAVLAILPLCQFAPIDMQNVAGPLGNIVHIILSLHALFIVVRGWKGDLVESRRQIRGPFLVAVPVYMLSVCAIQIWTMSQPMPAWYPLTNALILCALAVAGAFSFLDPRPDLFGASDPAPQPVRAAAPLTAARFDRAVRADLDRLDALMRCDQVWREEGLTIASLAVRLSIPEAHLRRLINDRLGHRNFPSFVNAHRIGSAKARLADPSEARTSISTIAYDVGFASLGPFNRAFREVTGVSPSEWRRETLSGDTSMTINASSILDPV